jgi:hypothetical protein
VTEGYWSVLCGLVIINRCARQIGCGCDGLSDVGGLFFPIIFFFPGSYSFPSAFCRFRPMAVKFLFAAAKQSIPILPTVKKIENTLFLFRNPCFECRLQELGVRVIHHVARYLVG